MEGWPSPVDGDGLENRYGCKPIQGSNPCPSATCPSATCTQAFQAPIPHFWRQTRANRHPARLGARDLAGADQALNCPRGDLPAEPASYVGLGGDHGSSHACKHDVGVKLIRLCRLGDDLVPTPHRSEVPGRCVLEDQAVAQDRPDPLETIAGALQAPAIP